MKTVTVIKTPKIPIFNENFIYNYYSKQENFINDKKFSIFDGEDFEYAVGTNNALSLTPPRYISFDLDLSSVEGYNQAESTKKFLAETPSIEHYLSIIENLGDSLENLFDIKKRRKYFNDINYLKDTQISDAEIDLTLAEDASEPYHQLVKFFDEEDPELILPLAGNEHYINLKKLYNAPGAFGFNDYKDFSQLQKNGDDVITNRVFHKRIKNSNKKIIYSYLEDKQSESDKNKLNLLKQNNIATQKENNESIQEFLGLTTTQQLNEVFNAVRNPSFLFGEFLGSSEGISQEQLNLIEEKLELILNSSDVSQSLIFNKSPKILSKSFDYIKGQGKSFLELNEFVVGFLIDKYYLFNNKKRYLCSNFKKLKKLSSRSDLNIQIIDKAVKYGRTYIYEVRPVLLQSFVKEAKNPLRVNYLILGRRTSSFAIKCVERESPLPPSHLELQYDLNQKGIYLKWGLPRNKQRDIANFQVFRRESPFEPFKLIKEFRKIDIDVVDNSASGKETPNQNVIKEVDFMTFNHLDKDIINNKIYIYAVCCVDAHGLSSAYSAQVAARFNGLTSNLEIDTISLAGALKQYPNQFFARKTKFYNFENDVISNTPIIKNKNKMHVFFTPDYKTIVKNNERVKILSLVKDKDKDYKNYFSISLTDINTLKTAKQNIYIQDREL